jgi:DNA-binding protein VF530
MNEPSDRPLEASTDSPALEATTNEAAPEIQQVQPEVHATRRTDPLHGMTLESILGHLVGVYGWDEMGYRIRIRCFNEDPSISSSLKFLRKTPWARTKVERLYVQSLDEPESIEPTPIEPKPIEPESAAPTASLPDENESNSENGIGLA